MVDIKNLKKEWKSDWITATEILDIDDPKQRRVVIVGEGEQTRRETKTNKVYDELTLPVELNKETRYLVINQFQQKFLDHLVDRLGSDTKAWVGAIIQLSVDKSGNIPKIDGLVSELPSQKVEG